MTLNYNFNLSPQTCGSAAAVCAGRSYMFPKLLSALSFQLSLFDEPTFHHPAGKLNVPKEEESRESTAPHSSSLGHASQPVVSCVWICLSRIKGKAVTAEPNLWSLKGTRAPNRHLSHALSRRHHTSTKQTQHQT